MDLTKKVTKGRKNFYRIGNVLYIGPGITQSQRVRARSEKARAAAEKHCRAESLGPNTRDSGCSVANLFHLKLQYFDHLLQKANSLEKSLMLGKIEGRRRRG